MARYFVGITGASGHVYATELIRALVRNGQEVDLAATPAGLLVLRHELGVDGGPNGEQLGEILESWLGPEIARGVRTFPCDAVGARAASGTSLTGGVILAPCSMGTLARVSVGFSSNLVERAADVAIKEGRQLVLMPREAPLSEIHLENMLRLARAGATIVPAMPTFYDKPRSFEDLADGIAGRALSLLGVQHDLTRPWPETGKASVPVIIS